MVFHWRDLEKVYYVQSALEDTIELHLDHTILIPIAIERNTQYIFIVENLNKLWTLWTFLVTFQCYLFVEQEWVSSVLR